MSDALDWIETRTLQWAGGEAVSVRRFDPEPVAIKRSDPRHTLTFMTSAPPRSGRANGVPFAGDCSPMMFVFNAGCEMEGMVEAGEARFLRLALDHDFILRAADRDQLGAFELKNYWGDGDPLLWQLAEAISAECEAGAPNGTLYVETAARLMAVHLLRHHSNVVAHQVRAATGGLSRRQLRLATEYMEAHLAEDVGLADVANACGLTVAHFARSFQRSTGVSPHRWRLTRRMEIAQRLLTDDTLPIIEVAAAVGYDSPAHFARMFRRYSGSAPLAFRAIAQGKAR